MNLNQLLQRAFEIFRHRYGVAANPEDHPVLWEVCLNLAAEQEDDQ